MHNNNQLIKYSLVFIQSFRVQSGLLLTIRLLEPKYNLIACKNLTFVQGTLSLYTSESSSYFLLGHSRSLIAQ